MIYGAWIEGDVPGPYRVSRDGRDIGTGRDMAEAVQIAKRACNEAASVFDRTPEINLRER